MSEEIRNTDPAAVAGGQQESNPAPAPEKTFTQEDVTAIAAKESKSAVEKLLKEAGLADTEADFPKALEAFRSWKDSQSGAVEAAEKDKAAAVAELEGLKKRVAAMERSIPAEMTEKYAKLAEAYCTDGVDFPAALDLALKDFPLPDPGTPGAGANPAGGKQGEEKPERPTGTVVF